MPRLVRKPTLIPAAGSKPKEIREYVGRVNTGTRGLSLARMRSPAGWTEPGQRPEFDEVTLVLRGRFRVETRKGSIEARAGEVVIARAGEWVRYSTPHRGGAEYVSVCVPAFSPRTVHRDA